MSGTAPPLPYFDKSQGTFICVMVSFAGYSVVEIEDSGRKLLGALRFLSRHILSLMCLPLTYKIFPLRRGPTALDQTPSVRKRKKSSRFAVQFWHVPPFLVHSSNAMSELYESAYRTYQHMSIRFSM